MTYFTGFIGAVPTANKSRYADLVTALWPRFVSCGANRMVETWGVDVPNGTVTDFFGAVQAADGETVVFSWVKWPDRATADAGMERMQEDPAMQQVPEVPFDGKRRNFGGFAPIFEAGTGNGAGYYQRLLLAVPDKNKAPYVDMALEGWKLFEKGGALGMIENWGEDVPRGKVTDFYCATKAEAGEVPVFSWSAWPDRATCDAAARAMEAEMDNMGMPQMPFDGMWMMWAGFEPLFDSAAAT